MSMRLVSCVVALALFASSLHQATAGLVRELIVANRAPI